MPLIVCAECVRNRKGRTGQGGWREGIGMFVVEKGQGDIRHTRSRQTHYTRHGSDGLDGSVSGWEGRGMAHILLKE